MDCVQARVAMSAELDGEALGVAEELLRAHVDRCLECQAWQENAVLVTRRLRLSTVTPPPELYSQIVLGTRPRFRRSSWLRRLRVAALLLCAVGQVIISVPDLAGNVMPGMEGMADHGMHEVAVFGFALALAFVVGAVRPRLAPGLAWVAGAAAVGLLITALSDIIGNRTFEAHEAQHLVAIVGALLLVWTALEHRDPDAGPLVAGIRPGRRHMSDDSLALDQDDAA